MTRRPEWEQRHRRLIRQRRVAEILRLRDDNLTHEQIARSVGCCTGTVSRVLRSVVGTRYDSGTPRENCVSERVGQLRPGTET